MIPTIFDRFENETTPSPGEAFAKDLADLLGARALMRDHALGVLAWGMPHMTQITSKSKENRERVAGYIATVLKSFEPRLEGVRVTSIDESVEFAFRIEARDNGETGREVALRVLTPMLGGGLGAEVVMINEERRTGSGQ